MKVHKLLVHSRVSIDWDLSICLEPCLPTILSFGSTTTYLDVGSIQPFFLTVYTLSDPEWCLCCCCFLGGEGRGGEGRGGEGRGGEGRGGDGGWEGRGGGGEGRGGGREALQLMKRNQNGVN